MTINLQQIFKKGSWHKEDNRLNNKHPENKKQRSLKLLVNFLMNDLNWRSTQWEEVKSLEDTINETDRKDEKMDRQGILSWPRLSLQSFHPVFLVSTFYSFITVSIEFAGRVEMIPCCFGDTGHNKTITRYLRDKQDNLLLQFTLFL